MTVSVRVDQVTKTFGGFTAVRDCSIEVRAGGVTGLIGPNGAGKTTLFNLVAGAFPPSAGRIFLGDAEITALKPHERAALGLSRTFQIPHEFSTLTALENLMAAPTPQEGEGLLTVWLRPGRMRAAEAEMRAKAREVIAFLGLDHARHELAGNLSGGQKKLLELGRTMMADARFVLLDEVAAGVNRTLLASLAEKIEALNGERGTTYFLIEHDVDFVARLCERVIVMVEGEVMTDGTPAEVRADARVIEAYFGRGPSATASSAPALRAAVQVEAP